jgi:TolB protein
MSLARRLAPALAAADGVIEPPANAGPSPDGSKIAFSVMESEPTDEGIYVVNANETGRRRLAPKSGSVPLWWPAWSPNGRAIAFVRNARLWMMKADGNAARKVGSGLRAASGPAWSPDGSRLAFVTYDSNDAARLLIVKPDGTGGRTSGPGVHGLSCTGAALAWSPDGSRIAFVRHGQVTVMNRDTTGLTRITPARAGYGIFGVDW